MILVDEQARTDGGYPYCAMDPVEGGRVNRMQQVGRLAEVGVPAGSSNLIIASNGFDQCCGMNLDFGGKLLKRIRLVCIDECLKYAMMGTRFFGYIFSEPFRRNKLARPICRLLHVVGIEYLRILPGAVLLAEIIIEFRH